MAGLRTSGTTSAFTNWRRIGVYEGLMGWRSATLIQPIGKKWMLELPRSCYRTRWPMPWAPIGRVTSTAIFSRVRSSFKDKFVFLPIKFSNFRFRDHWADDKASQWCVWCPEWTVRCSRNQRGQLGENAYSAGAVFEGARRHRGAFKDKLIEEVIS